MGLIEAQNVLGVSRLLLRAVVLLTIDGSVKLMADGV